MKNNVKVLIMLMITILLIYLIKHNILSKEANVIINEPRPKIVEYMVPT